MIQNLYLFVRAILRSSEIWSKKNIINTRMYCHSCKDFKLMRFGGSRNEAGWICKSCIQRQKEFDKKNG